MVLRYSNPNSDNFVGEVTVSPAGGGGAVLPEDQTQSGNTVTHKFLLQPTSGNPEFLTVSGEKGIYSSLFDLEPGQWTVAVKIDNNDPQSEDILVVRKHKM